LADLTIATIVFVAIVPYAKKHLSALLIELCARSSGEVFGLLSRTSPLAPRSFDCALDYKPQLGSDKTVILEMAIPIKGALVAETPPPNRANATFALGLLGDLSGRGELKRMCRDEYLPPEFRLYAVRYMFNLGTERDERCV